MANSINVLVTADDVAEAELVSGLITAALNTHGFEDVNNASALGLAPKEEEVVESMKALNPSLFQYEVNIEAAQFEDPAILGGNGLATEEEEDITVIEEDE